LGLLIVVLSLPTITVAASVVFEASGASPADIQDAVVYFRAFLGPLNPNVAGSSPMAAERSTGTVCQTPSQTRTISRPTSLTSTLRAAPSSSPRGRLSGRAPV